MARGRKKQYQRDLVLEKAMLVFWQKGYEGAHLQALVDSTGVNRFSLYSEFTGKEGLFIAALDHYLSKAKQHYQGYLAQQPLGLSNIKNYFSEMTFADDYHGCMMVNTLNNQHAVPKKAFERAESFCLFIEQAYLTNLKAEQQLLNPQLDIPILAKQLLSLDLGLSLTGIIKGGIDTHSLITMQLENWQT